ncbi:unnamed protein product [Paramecium octaurelia]|uniref:Uncharacterized protein n=1 Tax=Paramecium octaurelia TaxID=43137 RepID=A0A8S1T5G9_PAROT|nr:unnamed protein product [Paramecium octaurelia]
MQDTWLTKQVTKYIVINEILSCEAFGCLYKGFYKEDETKLIAVKLVKIAVTLSQARPSRCLGKIQSFLNCLNKKLQYFKKSIIQILQEYLISFVPIIMCTQSLNIVQTATSKNTSRKRKKIDLVKLKQYSLQIILLKALKFCIRIKQFIVILSQATYCYIRGQPRLLILAQLV